MDDISLIVWENIRFTLHVKGQLAGQAAIGYRNDLF